VFRSPLDPGSVKDLKEMEALDASQRASSHPLLLASVAEVLPSTSGITGDASNTPTTSAKSLSNDDSSELSALGKRTWRRRTCAVQPPQAILAAVSSAPVLEEKKVLYFKLYLMGGVFFFSNNYI